MKVSKEVPRPICACGNARCPLPKFQAILKFGRKARRSIAAAAAPSSPSLSAA